MLKFIKDRLGEYSTSHFINDLADASKFLGILEAKIDTYKFNRRNLTASEYAKYLKYFGGSR